jgi:RHS repeat-associated protein
MDDTAAANTVWKATLGPFDRERITVDTIGGYHLGFPGQYHDQETGFAYNINRDYDPSTGRYLQPDPIGLMGGANRYGYAGQSPVMMVDSLGLAACYVLFPDYPIQYAEGRRSTWLGGHAGILTYDDNGFTRYYEFGRYGPHESGIIGARRPADEGNVKNRAVPNLAIGKDGRATASSLQNLRDALSRTAGQGTPTELECDEEADESLVEEFVLTTANNPARDPYSWNPLSPNHCRSFAEDALEAGQ